MLKINKIIVLFTSVILFFYNFSYAQKEFEYMGVLKIQDTSMISYRLNLRLKGNLVSGYSVTNIGGLYETKSYVKGTYDDENNLLNFQEYGIEYTKSDVDTYDFCFVHFSGKLGEIQKQFTIEGDFKGKYEDGVACIDGELMVRSMEKIYKRVEKTDKRIRRMKMLPDSVKNKVSLTKTIDEKRINLLKVNEKTSVFCDSNMIKLKIWDSGKIDGDKITIRVDDKIILRNYVVSRKPKILEILLRKVRTEISIKAENEGEIVPNTAIIELIDTTKNIKVVSNLKYNETTSLVLHQPSKAQ